MQIAFIGPSCHQLTHSSAFFVDILRQLGSVQLFWDESWTGLSNDWIYTFDPGRFDCVVVWQWSTVLTTRIDELIKHRNAIVVPMYDQLAQSPHRIWKILFERLKVVCFSSTVCDVARRYGSKVRSYRYYPDPGRFDNAAVFNDRAGFLWRRTNQITEHTVAVLTRGLIFERFTLHWSPDPGTSIGEPGEDSAIKSRNFKRSVWYPSKDEYLEEVAKHNLFFAPRQFEGIGMAFLEAMAMGLCVVAPNTPTHNEYITHSRNGLLYSRGSPPLHLNDVSEMGYAAREDIRTGHEMWLSSIDSLCCFIVGEVRL